MTTAERSGTFLYSETAHLAESRCNYCLGIYIAGREKWYPALASFYIFFPSDCTISSAWIQIKTVTELDEAAEHRPFSKQVGAMRCWVIVAWTRKYAVAFSESGWWPEVSNLKPIILSLLILIWHDIRQWPIFRTCSTNSTESGADVPTLGSENLQSLNTRLLYASLHCPPRSIAYPFDHHRAKACCWKLVVGLIGVTKLALQPHCCKIRQKSSKFIANWMLTSNCSTSVSFVKEKEARAWNVVLFVVSLIEQSEVHSVNVNSLDSNMYRKKQLRPNTSIYPFCFVCSTFCKKGAAHCCYRTALQIEHNPHSARAQLVKSSDESVSYTWPLIHTSMNFTVYPVWRRQGSWSAHSFYS